MPGFCRPQILVPITLEVRTFGKFRMGASYVKSQFPSWVAIQEDSESKYIYIVILNGECLPHIKCSTLHTFRM